MDQAHLHLLTNHFPIVGILVGAGVMAYGYFTGSETVKSAALWIFFAMAIFAIPTFLTGEPAEDKVEGLPGISKAIIHDHEEAGELAFWVAEALGLWSVLALFQYYRNRNFFSIACLIALLLSLLTFGLMARTGYLGGKIRHTEINQGGNNAGNPEQEHGHDD